eukprot:9201517-Karenia_brevis.AAC.1
MRVAELQVWGGTPEIETTDERQPPRRVALPNGFQERCRHLPKHTIDALPDSIAGRYCAAWAESLKEALEGHEQWSLLCEFRARLLLGSIEKDADLKQEIKVRLALWEHG